MSLFRRRLMMAGGGGEPFVIPYITENLVFMVDGIYKGDKSGVWLDLVGGLEFPVTSHMTATQESYYFDGSGLSGTPGTSVLRDVGTIEMVAKSVPNTNQMIFSQCADNAICLARRTNNFSWAHAGGVNSWNYVLPTDFCVSANGSRACVNCASISVGTVNSSWTPNKNGHISIGGRYSATPYYTTGYICCIRMYDRYLTTDEMLYNQAIDNERFNLGLNI